jgi:hypothetical protein
MNQITPMDFETYQSEDPIVAAVIRKMYQRSQVGIKKYGTTLEENNEDDFLNHAIEEAMDLILYLTKVKSILEKKGISNLQNIK